MVRCGKMCNETNKANLKKIRGYFMISYCSSTIPDMKMHNFIEANNICGEYSCYQKWLAESIFTNKSRVKKEKLKYLYNTYEELYNNVQVNFDCKKYLFDLEVINTSLKNKNRLKSFFKRTEDEYKNISGKRSENYQFYDNLGSWYKLKLDLTARTIHSLKMKSVENIEKNEKKEYIVTIQYKNEQDSEEYVFLNKYN